jgi:hypothetical protein
VLNDTWSKHPLKSGTAAGRKLSAAGLLLILCQLLQQPLVIFSHTCWLSATILKLLSIMRRIFLE